MKWEMELDEIEAVLEKIWDLHDKLSDAIHSISRTHFLNSIKSLRKSDDFFLHRTSDKKKSFSDSDVNQRTTGFVFVKDFRAEEEDDDKAIQEAKSLNAIRTALENLEDQLEIFHTVQTQQRAERDAAIARLEQSRIVLAMRLAEHQGNKYKVIEEAKAFVGNVHNATHSTSPEIHYDPSTRPTGDNNSNNNENNPNILFRFLVSGFNFAKQSLKLEHMGGVLGNAALVAASMFALLHFHQVTCNHNFVLDGNVMEGHSDGTLNGQKKKIYRGEGSSASGSGAHLDVFLARG